jgi:hypothetical protein
MGLGREVLQADFVGIFNATLQGGGGLTIRRLFSFWKRFPQSWQ